MLVVFLPNSSLVGNSFVNRIYAKCAFCHNLGGILRKQKLRCNKKWMRGHFLIRINSKLHNCLLYRGPDMIRDANCVPIRGLTKVYPLEDWRVVTEPSLSQIPGKYDKSTCNVLTFKEPPRCTSKQLCWGTMCCRILRASNDVSSKFSWTRLPFLATLGGAFETGKALSTRYDVLGFDGGSSWIGTQPQSSPLRSVMLEQTNQCCQSQHQLVILTVDPAELCQQV